MNYLYRYVFVDYSFHAKMRFYKFSYYLTQVLPGPPAFSLVPVMNAKNFFCVDNGASHLFFIRFVSSYPRSD